MEITISVEKMFMDSDKKKLYLASCFPFFFFFLDKLFE